MGLHFHIRFPSFFLDNFYQINWIILLLRLLEREGKKGNIKLCKSQFFSLSAILPEEIPPFSVFSLLVLFLEIGAQIDFARSDSPPKSVRRTSDFDGLGQEKWSPSSVRVRQKVWRTSADILARRTHRRTFFMHIIVLNFFQKIFSGPMCKCI